MGYTKTQLLEVEDVAAKHGLGEIQEVRFATTALDAEQTGGEILRDFWAD